MHRTRKLVASVSLVSENVMLLNIICIWSIDSRAGFLGEVISVVNPSEEAEVVEDCFKVLQWNCIGLNKKVSELIDFMNKRYIIIAVLQKTKLTSRYHLTSPTD